MSYGANLIRLFGFSGFCMVLFVATQYQHLITKNTNATINDIIVQQRAKVIAEMEDFEYSFDSFGGKVEKLSDLTPETEGTPMRSIIVSTMRSGSSFTGEILNAVPGNLYYFEPLMEFGFQRLRDPDNNNLAISKLKNLLHCNYQMDSFINNAKNNIMLLAFNKRLWEVCKKYPLYCWRSKFLEPFCKLFPLQTIKILRLSLNTSETLLEDKSLNVRIILLVRDPRGVMNSRNHCFWCWRNCTNTQLICENLVEDYRTAEVFIKKYPSRLRILRYEDLSVDVYNITRDVLQFYGLPYGPSVERYLDTRTKIKKGGIYSTYRVSKSTPFHWKQDLKPEQIKYIQEHCAEAMKLWGYREIKNFTDYSNFDPVIMPPPFT